MTTESVIRCDRSRILVVDADDRIRGTFRLILCREFPDHRIELAANGVEVVEMFAATHDGGVLMDLSMPVMDGHAAFTEISRMCETKNWEMPSIVFCTGYDPPDGVKTIVVENPTHSLLLKPISSESLCKAVKRRC